MAAAGAAVKRLKRDDGTGLALHQLIGDVVLRFVGPKKPLSAISSFASHRIHLAAPAAGAAAKWEGYIDLRTGSADDGGFKPGLMLEAFAETDDDMSSVILVASEFHSREVSIRLTPQAALAARAAGTTAAEFGEARRLARAQLDAWPLFAATAGEWTRERSSTAPAMTDLELEGGPLLALGLQLPALFGAGGAPARIAAWFDAPGCVLTEVRKKRVCAAPAMQANKDALARVWEINDDDDRAHSEEGPFRVLDVHNEGIDASTWLRRWPTAPPE